MFFLISYLNNIFNFIVQISKKRFDVLSGKMVNLYEVDVTFQDIEYQFLKNILHHFRH